jgi:hypothetical protein
MALQLETKTRESDAKRARIEDEKALDSEKAEAACAAARLETLQMKAAERDFISRRIQDLEKAVASGAMTTDAFNEELRLLSPKRKDGISVRDFVINVLRGDHRLAAAVEREAKRLVASQEHFKPTNHFDNLGRVMWFLGPDGEFLKDLYNAESDRRAGISNGQQRLGFS